MGELGSCDWVVPCDDDELLPLVMVVAVRMALGTGIRERNSDFEGRDPDLAGGEYSICGLL